MKFVFLLAGILTMPCLQAQRVSSIVSAPDKDVFPDGKIVRAGNFLVGFDEGKIKARFMAIGFDGTIDKLGAVIYDTNMNALKAIPLTEAANNHGPLFTDMQVINGIPYVIYHEVKGKTGLGNIMAVPIDLTHQKAGKAIVITDVDKAGFDFRYNMFGTKEFAYSFFQSPDSAYQLVLIQAKGGACLITVLDKDFKVKWSIANVFTKDEKANVRSACVTNSGNVYLAIQRDVKNAVDMRLVPVANGKREEDIMLDVPNASWFAPQILQSNQKPVSYTHLTLPTTERV